MGLTALVFFFYHFLDNLRQCPSGLSAILTLSLILDGGPLGVDHLIHQVNHLLNVIVDHEAFTLHLLLHEILGEVVEVFFLLEDLLFFQLFGFGERSALLRDGQLVIVGFLDVGRNLIDH